MITEQQREELEGTEKEQAEAKKNNRTSEEAQSKVREIKIDLGMINPEEEKRTTLKLIGNKKQAKQKVVRTISERIT